MILAFHTTIGQFINENTENTLITVESDGHTPHVCGVLCAVVVTNLFPLVCIANFAKYF